MPTSRARARRDGWWAAGRRVSCSSDVGSFRGGGRRIDVEVRVVFDLVLGEAQVGLLERCPHRGELVDEHLVAQSDGRDGAGADATDLQLLRLDGPDLDALSGE